MRGEPSMFVWMQTRQGLSLTLNRPLAAAQGIHLGQNNTCCASCLTNRLFLPLDRC